jgi:predicted TIM-barrel fold metal-dependent hydrolase
MTLRVHSGRRVRLPAARYNVQQTMRIDIHCHTFNASDIPARFLENSRFAAGFWAEAWYGLPGPLKDMVVQLILDAVGQGPTAREELEELDRNVEAKAGPGVATALANGGNLDQAARLLLLEAFDDPDDPVAMLAPKSLLGLEREQPVAPDDELIFGRMVDYAFRSPPRARPLSKKRAATGEPVLGTWMSPELREFWTWMPEVPEEDALRAKAKAAAPPPPDDLEQQLEDAWREYEVERGLVAKGASALPAKRPTYEGPRWIRKLVRKTARWAERTGQASKAAVLDLARGLARRLRAAKEPVTRLIQFVRLLRSSRQDIVRTLCTTYPSVDLFTPALVDYAAVTESCPRSVLADQIGFWETFMRRRVRSGQRPLVHLYVPFDPYWVLSNEYVADDCARLRTEIEEFLGKKEPLPPLAEMVRHPAWLHERDPDVLLVLRYAIERAGFIGVKLYPPAKFAPYGNEEARQKFDKLGHGKGLDLVLEAIYTYCADNDVPILAHASEGNAFEKGYGKLAGPAYWRKALDRLGDRRRRLRLCLGHFGHFHHTPTWGEEFARLIQENDFVYGDVSNSSIAGSARERELFVAALKRLIAAHDRLPWRLLYGTDWMLNTLGGGHASYFDSFGSLFETEPELQPFRDAFLGNNAARFLFLDADGKLNQNHDRLRRFYASEQQELPEVLSEAALQAAGA